MKINQWFRALIILIGALSLTWPASALSSSDSSSIASPESNVTVRVARTKIEDGKRCVSKLIGEWDLDQFTRITLSSEVTHSWEPSHGMRAMSLVIRGLGRYHVNQPANWHPFCRDTQPFSYHLDDQRVAFAPRKSSKTHGIVGNRPNDRSTDTMGKYMQRQSGMVYFNDCIHQMMNNSSSSLSPEQIVTTVFANPGTCATLSPCSNIDPDNCTYTNLTETTYTLHNGLKSMTNRTAVHTPPYSSQNINPIGYNQQHQAEVFWGNDMTYSQVSPHGQPGTYIIGTGHAVLTEYLADSWGSNARLYVNAIADKPQPVIANVYVDGYYWGWLEWNHNDNQKHLDWAPLPDKYSGLHTIAIQFREAAWLGGGADGTRWLYLDDLGIAP